MKKKPVLGVIPKRQHNYNRMLDISNAIYRYLEVEKKIPIDWVQEYNELAEAEK